MYHRWSLMSIIFVMALVSCTGPTTSPTQPIVTTAPSVLPSATSAPSAIPPAATPTSQTGKRLRTGTITSKALAGNLIGDPATRNYYVYLPPDYDTSTKHYPVLYVLYLTLGGSTETFVEPISSAVNTMISKGGSQDSIIVFLDDSNRFGMTGGLGLGSSTMGDYETYLSQEAVAAIDSTYRTLPQPASRGITGCSNNADGAFHMALTHPDVFGAAAGVSGQYEWADWPKIQDALPNFTSEPKTWADYGALDWTVQWYMGLAAVASPNKDKPPFYLNMPFQIVNGKPAIVEGVAQKTLTLDPLHLVPQYLKQPVRSKGLMMINGDIDENSPIALVRDFEKLLTRDGIQHQYTEVHNGGHCNDDYWPAALKFMSDTLAK